MENKKLAIKGHPRGKEVIEILEMLGGKNGKLEGDSIESLCGNNPQGIYYIQTCNNLICIRHADSCELNDFIIFTLEEFLEKYPFKVGDKVQHKGSTSCGTIYVIEKMMWDNNQIKYIIYNPWRNIPKCTVTVTAEDLQPFKEEIKAEDRLEIYTDHAIDDSKTDITIDGEKLIAPNGYTVKTATMDGNNLIVEYIKNKPQYPKTYVECSQIINKVAKTTHELDIAYNPNLIYDFQELLICRDAYWKIAGEEMGLSGSWAPDYTSTNRLEMHFIYCTSNEISYGQAIYPTNKILIFPTRELRDAFFENFKDLIENCKEFL